MHDRTSESRPLVWPFAGAIAELRNPPKGQIPFLDGLRAIAILLVVSGHFSGDFARANGPTLYSRLPFVANGWIGVDLFFVLSGFFIGGQLWKELRREGTVQVGRFMIRRGLRIWPLYYFVFLCLLAVASVHGNGAAAKEYGWSDLVFLTNYHNRGLVMGSWSLCTEEQFYIITPLALYFLARHLRAVQRCRPWLWVLLALAPLLRLALWLHYTGHFFASDPALFATMYYMSITHCDGLIMGLIISNLWETRAQSSSALTRPWPLVAIAAVIMVALHAVQKEIFDFSALAIFFGSFVWLGVQRKVRIFDSRIFYWLSRLSFGMYLNHEYLAPWLVEKVLPRSSSAHLGLAYNLLGVALLTVLSAAVALVTFCFVEHPFLQLRKIVLGSASGAPTTRDLTPVTQ